MKNYTSQIINTEISRLLTTGKYSFKTTLGSSLIYIVLDYVRDIEGTNSELFLSLQKNLKFSGIFPNQIPKIVETIMSIEDAEIIEEINNTIENFNN
jgi:hypothetical protein